MRKKFLPTLIGAILAIPVWFTIKPEPIEPEPQQLDIWGLPVTVESPLIVENKALKFIGKEIYIVEEFSETDTGLSISLDFSHEGLCSIYSNVVDEGRAFYQAFLNKRWKTKYSLRYDEVTQGVSFVDIEAPMVDYQEFIKSFLATILRLPQKEFTITGHPALMSYLKAGINGFTEEDLKPETPPTEKKEEPKPDAIKEDEIPVIEPEPAPVVKKPVVKKKSSPPPRRRSSPP